MFQQGITAFCLLLFTWHGTGFSIPNHQHKQHRLHAQNHMTLETASSTTSNSYLHDWNLDPYDLDNDTLITLAVDMFSTYDVSQFGVKEEQIRSFLKEVQGRYNRHPGHHVSHLPNPSSRRGGHVAVTAGRLCVVGGECVSWSRPSRQQQRIRGRCPSPLSHLTLTVVLCINHIVNIGDLGRP